ncbi:DNA primase [Alkalihalobacterium chitinilyticum]|uniref:DNA primase n=1 Tax=Alkalihalobacterium chitinilyticum TaxID=2980103 RepID=A0ABT5VF01_9BACI|nr:DNA primase [Alkalihalobacterium chitinilyticum]MDE5413912.1 DNA primase [Alkalihalobacterium chitinilyticum]
MGYRIPEEKVEEVRKSADIVEVINEYVQLKKQGRNYIGLCPFHGEKTPSFSVSPDKQLYHCFGCGAGGNVFSFLMELEGLSFVESVAKLGKKANVELPSISTDQKKSNEQSVIEAAHELAMKFYHHILLKTEMGAPGLNYLEQRGFTKEMLDTFQLGFAPNHWDSLTSLLEKRGFNLKALENAGLLSLREFDGKVFDRFRNRIMFPIWDGQGNVIAFGGRIIDDGKPKYLNSPETVLFNKSRTLYGIHLARPSIRKLNQAVLFEGYVDVISAWGAGVLNGIATLGTALTEEQAKVIRRNAETVILCYDSDEAGIQATSRAASILVQAGCYVKVALLPEGQDPDDYIRLNGGEHFKRDIIESSLTLMSFKMQYLRRGKNLQDEGERMRYIEEVLNEISDLPRAVERDHYLRQIASEFSLSLDALKQEQFRMYRERRNKGEQQQSNVRSFVEVKKRGFEQKKLLPAFHNAERILLAYMMKNAEIAATIQEKVGGAFNIDEYHAIVAHLFAYYGEGYEPNPSLFIERLNDEKLRRVATEVAMLDIREDLSDQELDDYIKKIETYPKWVEIEQKEKEKKEAEKRNDVLLAAQIAMEIIQMKKDLKR